MVHPNEILEGLKETCTQSSFLPSTITYATVELDAESEHANVSLPIIEFTVDEIERDLSRNNERVGTEYDSNDNEIGYVYQGWFDMQVTASVITASRGEENHRDLDQRLRKTLAVHDDHKLGRPLPDPASTGDLTGISLFQVGNITPAHDFESSPTMRAREITLFIGFVHDYYTTELEGPYDFVEDVNVSVDAE